MKDKKERERDKIIDKIQERERDMKDNIMELGIQMFTLDARYMYRYNITWIDGKRDFS